MHLLLFDIDGTLLKPIGIGKKAFINALKKKFKVTNLIEFRYDGLLDSEILEKSLSLLNVEIGEEEKQEILEDYYFFLEKELKDYKEPLLCPNVPQILEEARSYGFKLAILTGNIKKAAILKLKYTNLSDYFEFGVYGDEGKFRFELVEIALQRAKRICGSEIDRNKVFIVGDSLKDIETARIAKVKVVAVATGLSLFDELKEAKPDILIENFLSSYFLKEIKKN